MPDACILVGDAFTRLKDIEAKSISMCVTSPPYFGLRDYGVDGQIGLESTLDAYVFRLVNVFHEVYRVLKDNGTLWLNLGDSYANTGTGGNGATGGRESSTLQSSMPPVGTTPVTKKVPYGLKVKDLIGIPWRVAFALQADGWYLRQDIIWHKPNPMPESVHDRCTKSHEYLFLLSKKPKYLFNSSAMQEQASSNAKGAAASFKRSHSKRAQCIPNQLYGTHRFDREDVQYNQMRNRRDVWTVATNATKEAHFATYPPALVEPCILAGSLRDDVVLDPFNGSGTSALVALANKRNYIGIELNPEYVDLTKLRVANDNYIAHRYKLGAWRSSVQYSTAYVATAHIRHALPKLKFVSGDR